MNPFRFAWSSQPTDQVQAEKFGRLLANVSESTPGCPLPAPASDVSRGFDLLTSSKRRRDPDLFIPGRKIPLAKFSNPYTALRLSAPCPAIANPLLGCVYIPSCENLAFRFRKDEKPFELGDARILNESLGQFNNFARGAVGRIAHKDVARAGSLRGLDEDALEFWASEALGIWEKLKTRSLVWSELEEATAGPYVAEPNNLLKGLLLSYMKKGRWRTLRSHVLVIRRLINDLEGLDFDGLEWSFRPIYNVMITRQREMLNTSSECGKDPPASTFSSMCRSLKHFKTIWGLDLPSDQNLAMLTRLAASWADEHLGETRQAADIPIAVLKAFETIICNAVIVSNADSDCALVYDLNADAVSLSTFLWIWSFRVFSGAGIRFGDGLYTAPAKVSLLADGLAAKGAQSKNRSRAQGRPWCVSAFPLNPDTPNWLRRGWEVFANLPNHESRDYWLGVPSADGKDFQDAPASWPVANGFLKLALKLSGVAGDFSEIRPHSLKATGINAASHLNMFNNSVGHAEIQIFGDYRPESSQAMQLTYTRKQQAIHLNVSKKIIMQAAENGAEAAYEATVANNKLLGLSALLEDNIWSNNTGTTQIENKTQKPTKIKANVPKVSAYTGPPDQDELLGRCWGSASGGKVALARPRSLPSCPLAASRACGGRATLVNLKALEGAFALVVRADEVKIGPTVHLAMGDCEFCSKPCDCLGALTIANCDEGCENWTASKFVSIEDLPAIAVLCVKCWAAGGPLPGASRVINLTDLVKMMPPGELPLGSNEVRRVLGDVQARNVL